MKKSGAQIVIESLEREGVEMISGIPGGNILPIYDALKDSKIQHILAKHEQGAAFIAQGIARVKGSPGVCMATSGPGAMNLITALADAKADSCPLVAITGQVSQNMIGKEAFQEVDICSMAKGVTKKVFFINKAEDITQIVREAFCIAKEGRPGPVLIDIPKDVQLAVVEVAAASIKEYEKMNARSPNESEIEEAIKLIDKAKRPVIIAGNGAKLSHSQSLIRQLAEQNSMAVTTTLHGLSIIPFNHPLNLGMAGVHGAKSANRIIREADLILALGIRFDDRLMGNVEEFCPQAKIIHIDISKEEHGKIITPHLAIHSDLKIALKAIMQKLFPTKRDEWEMRIAQLHYAEGHKSLNPEENSIYPVSFLEEIQSLIPDDAIIVTDVGQHQMWVAQHFPFTSKHTFLSSGGQGTMGFGLPVAIGASVAQPERKVVLFTGDGSFLMNVQELATLKELGCNITVFVMNNSQLGMVRQQQEMFYQENYMGSIYSHRMDFSEIARGFGIRSCKIVGEYYHNGLWQKYLSTNEPCVIDVSLYEAKNILPMVIPGRANVEVFEYQDS